MSVGAHEIVVLIALLVALYCAIEARRAHDRARKCARTLKRANLLLGISGPLMSGSVSRRIADDPDAGLRWLSRIEREMKKVADMAIDPD